jgi:hypothetical protein
MDIKREKKTIETQTVSRGENHLEQVNAHGESSKEVSQEEGGGHIRKTEDRHHRRERKEKEVAMQFARKYSSRVVHGDKGDRMRVSVLANFQ